MHLLTKSSAKQMKKISRPLAAILKPTSERRVYAYSRGLINDIIEREARFLPCSGFSRRSSCWSGRAINNPTCTALSTSRDILPVGAPVVSTGTLKSRLLCA